MARHPDRQTIDERIVDLYGEIKQYENDTDNVQRNACNIVDGLPEVLEVMGEQLINDVLQMRLADALRVFVERVLADPQADLRGALDTVRTILYEDFAHSGEALADLPRELTAASNTWVRGNARVAEVAALMPGRL